MVPECNPEWNREAITVFSRLTSLRRLQSTPLLPTSLLCALWFILSIFYRFEKWYSSWDISAQTCSPWPLFAGQLCQNHAPRMLETKFQFFNLVCFPRRRWYVRNGSEFPSLAWSSKYFWLFFENLGSFWFLFGCFGHFFVRFPGKRWYIRNGSEFFYVFLWCNQYEFN